MQPCGSDFSRDAFASGQELSSSCGANGEAGPQGEGQDAQSKEKARAWRLPGSYNCSCVVLTRAYAVACPTSPCDGAVLFDSTSLCWRKGIGIVPIALRACRLRRIDAQGSRVERRASCAHSEKATMQRPTRNTLPASRKITMHRRWREISSTMP
jgi:hypothetical protein